MLSTANLGSRDGATGWHRPPQTAAAATARLPHRQHARVRAREEEEEKIGVVMVLYFNLLFVDKKIKYIQNVKIS